jgi:hypothetical protein
MSIYDNGTEFAWEIWVGLLIAAVVLYFAVRASRKSDRRHQAKYARATPPPASPPRRPTAPGTTPHKDH